MNKSEYNKLWQKNNTEKTRKYSKNYRLNNKEKVKEKSKLFYLKNKEEIKIKSKEYYLKNREYILNNIKKQPFKYEKFNSTYKGMVNRCTDYRNKNYHNYGARGIKCMWKSFEEFKKDMYESYLEHLKKHGNRQTTLERIDNNGNYCKKNCRWATMKEQSNNTRFNHYLTYKGKTQTMTQWSEELGINYLALHSRITKYKWTVEKALSKNKKVL